MVNKDRIVESFMEYVKISSPTTQEKEFALFIEAELKKLGFEVSYDNSMAETGSNVGNMMATLKSNKEGGKPILFSCHLDTVSPGVGIKPILEENLIRSDGKTILAADDKAGIAAIIEAIKVIKEENLEHADIELAFSVYEEGGLKGAQAMDYSLFKSEHAYVLDSSGSPGEIIVRAPAQDKLNFVLHGRAAHAGVAPEEGISAISVAAEAISNMKLLRIDEETTANIGRIEGGGATNIVPDEVLVFAEARSISLEKLDLQSKHMIECFEEAAKKFGASVDIECSRMYPSFSVSEDAEIVKDALEACDRLGFKTLVTSTGGGSDTNIINSKGKTAVNLGIGERKPHSLEEHIYIEDLVNSSKLVLELIKLYAQK